MKRSLLSLAIGAVISAPFAIAALGLDACAHGAASSSDSSLTPCENRAKACPGGLALCSSNGETACVAHAEEP